MILILNKFRVLVEIPPSDTWEAMAEAIVRTEENELVSRKNHSASTESFARVVVSGACETIFKALKYLHTASDYALQGSSENWRNDRNSRVREKIGVSE